MNQKLLFLLLPLLLLFPLTAQADETSQSPSPWVEVKPIGKNPSKAPKHVHKKVTSKSKASTNTKKKSTSSRLSRKQNLRFRYLQSQIIAPCCWVQPVSLHPSKTSDQIKVDLKKRILAGETNKEILALYVKEFGERILSIPPHSDIIWLPVLVGILFFAIALFFIVSWSLNKKTRYKK